MAQETVRELLTKWNFDVDTGAVKKFNDDIKRSKTLVRDSARQIQADMKLAAKAFLIGGAGLGFFLREAGQLEQTEVAFKVMLGNAELAKRILEEVKQFAVATPFEFKGVIEGAKRLRAFGFEAKELVPTLQILGDISAGVGTDKLPQLILALGQVRTATKLRGQELRQFSEAGVPLIAELAKTLNVAESEVAKLVSAGKVGFTDVQKSLKNMTGEGGRFNNLMREISKTLLGLFANARDDARLLVAEIGKELLPEAKAMLKAFIKIVDVNKEIIKTNLVEFLRNVFSFLKGLITVGRGIVRVFSSVASVFGGVNNMLKLLGTAFTFFLSARLLTSLGNISIGIVDIIQNLRLLGKAGIIAQLKLVAIPLAVGAAMVATFLIIEDLITAFQGGNSVIKDFALFITGVMASLNAMFINLGVSIATFITKPFVRAIEFIKASVAALGSLLPESVKGLLGGGGVLGKIGGLFGGGETVSANAGIAPATSPATTANNSSVQVNAPIEVNIPEGMTPGQAQEAVSSGVSDGLKDMLRQTRRAARPAVEF